MSEGSIHENPSPFGRPRWWVPEVVQSSGMDCGPASLKAVLEGFGISVSYGRLREACQTDVDGTSIDSLEDVAVQLGLVAEQVMIPVDHLLIPAARALPGLVVVRLPSGVTHFVVAWRKVGGFLQVMDPGSGRSWTVAQRFLGRCYRHAQAVPAAAWREWAGSEEFQKPLDQRLARLGVDDALRRRHLGTAADDPDWQGIAALDAATRMGQALLDGGALWRHEAARLFPKLLEQAQQDAADLAPTPQDGNTDRVGPGDEGTSGEQTGGRVPQRYWSVRPTDDEDTLKLHGGVLIRFLGRRPRRTPQVAKAEAPTVEASTDPIGKTTERATVEPRASAETPSSADAAEEPRDHDEPPLPPELIAALEEKPESALRTLWGLVKQDGLRTPLAMLGSTLAAAAVVLIEALLLRAALDVGPLLGSQSGRLGAALALVVFAGLVLGLHHPVLEGALRLGRHLEMRLRIRFYEKIPRLPDRYFASRLISDMAERSHSVRSIRSLPALVRVLTQNASQLLFTTAGILWLDPGSAPVALTVAAVSLGLPMLAHPLLAERNLKVRNHTGALSRFYLDGLLGLITIRAHAAERAVRREHEALLIEWRRSSLDLLRMSVAIESVQSLVGFGLGAWLLVDHLNRAGLGGGVLLLVYWALQLPALGQTVATTARQLPNIRSVVLRLMEPLSAPEDPDPEAEPRQTSEDGAPGAASLASPSTSSQSDDAAEPGGVAIAMDGVAVRASGHWLLRGVDLRIEPGEHLAVVGPSGAGKSTLVGLLLGWQRPVEGELRIDGQPFDALALRTLRRHTAWVDPAVQLWNRSLHRNLRYGTSRHAASDLPLDRVLHMADLESVLDRLPDGLRTPLGEGGSLVSGGEGQRVRFARALHRPGTRLVVLDEPFRGLDRGKRRQLLEAARRRWPSTTILCVTHDVADTTVFPRVLVVENGRLVEDGRPEQLLARDDSPYARLVAAEKELRKIWNHRQWRRLWVEDGHIAERFDAEPKP